MKNLINFLVFILGLSLRDVLGRENYWGGFYFLMLLRFRLILGNIYYQRYFKE